MNIYKYYDKPGELRGYEQATMVVPELAYSYAKKTGKRFPEGERAIAIEAYYAYGYAREVLEGRFPEGEAAIASDASYAYYYAMDVLKGRFPEGEAAIASDAQ